MKATILFFVLIVAAASAQAGQDDLLKRIGLDQRLNETVPLSLKFRDENGQTVQLQRYFGSKPVVLVLAYYECPMLCTQVLNGLLGSLRNSSLDAGRDFQVVVVSINPTESPALAMAKKRQYLNRYNRPGAEEGWHFLTGDEDSIQALARSVGFRYAYDAEQKQYAHAAGIMVVTPLGKLARYFYGIEYSPKDLRLGLIEASAGKIGTLTDRVLLYCYHYDPARGRYGLAIMRVIQGAGVVTMTALGSFVALMLRREKIRKRAA